MKRIVRLKLSAGLLLLAALCVRAQSKAGVETNRVLVSNPAPVSSRYSLTLLLTGFKDSTLFRLVDLDKESDVDSAFLIDGRLRFKGSVAGPTPFRIHTGKQFLVVYLENKAITVKGDARDFQYSLIKGSVINDYATKSRDATRSLDSERSELINHYFMLSDSDMIAKKAIGARMNQIDSQVFQYRLNFIRAERPTYFTLNELYFLRNDLRADTLKNLYDRFPVSLRSLKQGKVIMQYIRHPRPETGTHFAEVLGKDINGRPGKLSAQKGKYTLLDFWASWCGPCRAENPTLLKAYAQYKKRGFAIFGVSVDVNRTSWLEAVRKDQLSWVNVSDLKGLYGPGAAAYHIRAIPQNFLIDPSGTIISINLHGEALLDKLKSIFPE